jgi:hypothetical protein
MDEFDSKLLSWLLESDSPGVRYLALRNLLDCPDGDAELVEARRTAHQEGEIAQVLANMHSDGYWSLPGAGYNPKYFSTVWSLILLAQLGARAEMDARIRKACDHLVAHALTPGGQFSASGAPSGTADCMQGNLSWALVELGYDHPRLDGAFEWMARSVTGEGIAPLHERNAPVRYYAGKCGPLFACGANNKLACAWGAAKVMLSFSRLSTARHTPLIDEAIRQGIEFLLSPDPATGNYPAGWAEKPSSNWWKFGFPVFYVTDILQIADALTALGCGKDPRLTNTLALIRQKMDAQGRWWLEYDYAGKTWVEFGAKKQPNAWVTLRALCVLKRAG